ncbi:hypothetical protein ONZ45_g9128 [Pleurotus djamor]|nr:hypothetical protein ONZ45_g9128 [Pleurotus djamor]
MDIDAALEARDVANGTEFMPMFAIREMDIVEGRGYEDYGESQHSLEARNPAAVARLAIQGIKSIVKGIKNLIKADKKARGEFTLHLVREMRKKYPSYNWVVCHTKHETKFKGQKGKDWDHRHEEFDVKFGGTIGYEIYNLKDGTFIRKGDGGYLNWAYSGKVTKKSKNGKEITFRAP